MTKSKRSKVSSKGRTELQQALQQARTNRDQAAAQMSTAARLLGAIVKGVRDSKRPQDCLHTIDHTLRSYGINWHDSKGFSTLKPQHKLHVTPSRETPTTVPALRKEIAAQQQAALDDVQVTGVYLGALREMMALLKGASSLSELNTAVDTVLAKHGLEEQGG